MSKTAVQIMPSPEMWTLMIKLARERQDQKNKLDNLIVARDRFAHDLSQMGDSEETSQKPEYVETMKAWGRTLRAIDACRARIKFLADQVESCVEHAAQGKLFDTGEVGQMEKDSKDVNAGLFKDVEKKAAAIASEQKKAEQAAADAKTTTPLAAGIRIIREIIDKGDSLDWFANKINGFVGMCQPDVEAINSVGLVTLQDLFRFVHIDNHKLATLDGMSASTAGRLIENMNLYVSRLGKQSIEEAAAKAAPKSSAKKPAPKPAKPAKGKDGKKKGGKQ